MGMNPDLIRPAISRRHGDTRYRVLVVEDNADIARLMTLLLEHSGFEVLTLSDGHPVLATARSFRPHFILLDIRLPGMDGYRVAEQLHGDSDLRGVVIIAASAYGPPLQPNRSPLAWFDHHLTKPISLTTLLPLLVLS
jgi:two-component system, sensor histidine kinase